MAGTKKQTTEVEVMEKVQAMEVEKKFSKEQIVSSDKYCKYRDLVNALLDDEKKYTFETVDNLIEKYMKGQVK